MQTSQKLVACCLCCDNVQAGQNIDSMQMLLFLHWLQASNYCSALGHPQAAHLTMMSRICTHRHVFIGALTALIVLKYAAVFRPDGLCLAEM